LIPEQLVDQPLIRLKPGSKEPVVDAYEVETVETVREWVRTGGNVGVSLKDDLVVLDIDSEKMQYVVEEEVGFPETFSVLSGSWSGHHEYFRCPGWDANKQFTDDGEDVGSIRSTGWQVAAPPSTHPGGGRYRVLHDAPIREADPEQFAELVDALDPDGDQDGDGDGERRDRGRVAGDDLDELDELIDHDGYRSDVREVLEDREAGHDRRLWVAGFLLDAAGLSVSETVRIIDKLNRWSNYDREITQSQVESVDRSSGGRSR